MTFDFTRLREALDANPPSDGQRVDAGAADVRSAAVLMLFTRAADPELTFIQRAATLRKHAGQVAFPGGGLEPQDDGPAAAALREANEEVGLDPAQVTVLGQLPVAWIPVSRFDVTPVVGTWDGAGSLWARDPREVESVFQVPVSVLVDPSKRVSARHPGGYRGPAWPLGELFLWGFTGHLVDEALRLAGWEREWDRERVVDVPVAFRRR